MSRIDDITKESWLMSVFPEWGTWLNEEIEQEKVQPGSVAMWWLGCTGVWIKTPGGCSITLDFWSGSGKRTHGNGRMEAGHQMANMSGSRTMPPNLRAIPMVLDPFAIKSVDAVLATHHHQDHISPEAASHIVKSGMTTVDENGHEIPVPFIGPRKSVELWQQWGVPKDRCITVRPGDSIRIKDTEILVLDSFDRTCLITPDQTGEAYEDFVGKCPEDMDEKAVNYLIRTPGGNIYHGGDSHYSSGFAKHGKAYDIDVAIGAFAENPVGVQDKMTSLDILRMAEALRCKVIIPVHYDVWTNFMADVNEIRVLYHMRKERLDYRFHPFFWEPGGKYVYPADRDKSEYHHRRGFEDCFEAEQNVPFSAFL